MLQSACCSNYLCIFCTQDIQTRELVDVKYVAECPYRCNTGTSAGKLKLVDVPEAQKLKRYADSQNMSIFSNNVNAVADQRSDNGIAAFQNPKEASKSLGGTSIYNMNVKDRLLAQQINGMSPEKKGNPNVITIRSFIDQHRNANDQQSLMSEYQNLPRQDVADIADVVDINNPDLEEANRQKPFQ